MIELAVWGDTPTLGSSPSNTFKVVTETLKGHLPCWARTPEHQMGLQDSTDPFSLSCLCLSHRGRGYCMVLSSGCRFGGRQIEGAAGHQVLSGIFPAMGVVEASLEWEPLLSEDLRRVRGHRG